MVAPLAAAIAGGLFRSAVLGGSTISRGIVAAALGEAEAEVEQTDIMVPVSSSAIRAIGYRVGDIIVVEFKRGGSITYEYPGTEEMFLAFLMAPSKGQWFNDHYGGGPPAAFKASGKKHTLRVRF